MNVGTTIVKEESEIKRQVDPDETDRNDTRPYWKRLN